MLHIIFQPDKKFYDTKRRDINLALIDCALIKTQIKRSIFRIRIDRLIKEFVSEKQFRRQHPLTTEEAFIITTS